jgi:hypothetical protein
LVSLTASQKRLHFCYDQQEEKENPITAVIMKQHWTPQELIDHWTLTPEEITMIKSISQTDYNQVGSGLLFKCFQNEGKFSQRKQDIPPVIVDHVSQQLQLSSNTFAAYQLKSRSVRRHQLRIRQLLQFRVGTVSDAKHVLNWLLTHDQLLEEHNVDQLKEIVYERYKELKIEPPQPKRIDRLVRSAVRTADERLYTKILSRIL